MPKVLVFVEGALVRSAEALVVTANVLRSGWLMAVADRDVRIP